jgi:hypothetical protein
MKVSQRITTTFCLLLTVILYSCGSNEGDSFVGSSAVEMPEQIEFGFNMIDYEVELDTVQRGDTFGKIMLTRDADYMKVNQAARISRKSFDLRKIQVGKPYRILKSCDSLEKPQIFIYENDFLLGES